MNALDHCFYGYTRTYIIQEQNLKNLFSGRSKVKATWLLTAPMVNRVAGLIVFRKKSTLFMKVSWLACWKQNTNKEASVFFFLAIFAGGWGETKFSKVNSVILWKQIEVASLNKSIQLILVLLSVRWSPVLVSFPPKESLQDKGQFLNTTKYCNK